MKTCVSARGISPIFYMTIISLKNLSAYFQRKFTAEYATDSYRHGQDRQIDQTGLMLIIGGEIVLNLGHLYTRMPAALEAMVMAHYSPDHSYYTNKRRYPEFWCQQCRDFGNGIIVLPGPSFSRSSRYARPISAHSRPGQYKPRGVVGASPSKISESGRCRPQPDDS